MAKNILRHSDLRKQYGQYPCPKCPVGYRLKPMPKKKGKEKKRKSLSDCKCVKAIILLGAGKYLKERYKQFVYGKRRKWTNGSK